jgi:hypothetical protein
MNNFRLNTARIIVVFVIIIIACSCERTYNLGNNFSISYSDVGESYDLYYMSEGILDEPVQAFEEINNYIVLKLGYKYVVVDKINFQQNYGSIKSDKAIEFYNNEYELLKKLNVKHINWKKTR